MIYLAIIIGFLALSYCYDYREFQRGRLMWWIIMLVVLILVSGLRYRMGADSIRYENTYDELPTLSTLDSRDFSTSRFAPLYVLLCAVCRSISRDFVVLQMVVAIFVNTVFFLFIYRNTRKIFITGFLYFIFLYIMLNMQVLREAIAVSFFLLGWKYYVKNNWILYYCFAATAFFFHVSAVVLFILPVLKLPKVSDFFTFGKKSWIILPSILILSFVIRLFFFDMVQALAFTEAISERAQTYSEDELGGETLNIKGTLGWLFRTCIYPLVGLYLLKKNGKEYSYKTRQIEIICMAGVYVSILCLGVMILQRYLNYFMIFEFIILSYVIYEPYLNIGRAKIRLKYLGWITALAPLICFVMYFDYGAKLNRSGTLRAYDMYYPYSNQFDREIAPNRKRAINYNRRIR